MPESIPRGPFDQGLFLAHLNKGRDHYEARAYEEAERELEEAYLLRPRDQKVLNLLGLVYFRQEKFDKAEEVYRKLVAESPEAHTLHYNLGLICFKLGRLEDAEAAFLKALEISQENPKISFYLGSIYERLHRYTDAIYQYRQAGANIMVRRVEDKICAPAAASAPVPPVDTTRHIKRPLEGLPLGKAIRPVVGEAIFAEPEGPRPSMTDTARFRAQDDTVPPHPPSEPKVPFRLLENNLLEVDFAGKVFIRRGSVYSYSGNLTFWVKEKRPGGSHSLVIVTGSGRIILSAKDREITLMQVGREPVYVEPGHLLACEESLVPKYVSLVEGRPECDVILLEGSGSVALAVASRPLAITVTPEMPVSAPLGSVIMWAGRVESTIVDDPELYELALPEENRGGPIVRLVGEGRLQVEQTT